MTVSAIVAMDRHNAIGKNNQLPWHLPEDLKFFKRTTLGKPVLMGRKTYESLGKPLKDRLNIVLSANDKLMLPEGVVLMGSIQAALRMLEQQQADEIFIIGGGRVFEETLAATDRLYITHVNTVVADADVFFPHIDHSQWKKVWEEPHQSDEKHTFDYTFCRYERVEL